MKKLILALAVVLQAGCASTGDTDGIAKQSPAKTLSTSDFGDAMSHYLSSVIHERKGEAEAAIAELRAAADLSPESTRLQVRLLGAYYLSEDYENAAIMAERAIEKEPGSVVLHIWRGRIYYQLEQFEQSTEAFQRAIELDPDNALAYEALAEIEESTNDLIGAIGVYEKMIEISPDSAFLHYRLGLNLLDMEDIPGAERELKTALELNAQLNGAKYMLGALALQEGRFEEALDYFRQFLAVEEGHLRTRVNMAGAHVQVGRYKRAITMLTEIIEGSQVDTQHHLQRTFVYLLRGEPIRPTLAPAPNGAPLLGTLLQALVRKMAGEPYAPLIASLDKADGDLDFECNVYLNDILSLYGEDAGDFFVRELRALMNEGLRSRVLEVTLARTYMSLEQNEQAVELLESIIDRYGSEKWLHYYMASSLDELDRPKQTEKHLRACLKTDPNDPDILNFLGYFLAEEDTKLGEAEELLERALQFDPENGFYLDSLGWVYYRQGKGKEAVEYIRRAIRAMNSDDAILRDHFGDAYLLSGDIANAVSQWRRARRLDPELEGVQKKIDKYLPRMGE